MINIDREKAEFKAILSDQLIDFGFQEDREEFFDWCVKNGYMNWGRYVRSTSDDSFYVYNVIKPIRFQVEHCKHKEHPDWETDIKACLGPMLVDTTYHPYGWGKYNEKL